jgi:hypothetical protein
MEIESHSGYCIMRKARPSLWKRGRQDERHRLRVRWKSDVERMMIVISGSKWGCKKKKNRGSRGLFGNLGSGAGPRKVVESLPAACDEAAKENGSGYWSFLQRWWKEI